MFRTIQIMYHQGKQFMPDPTKAKVPGIFRGRPEISLAKVDEKALAELCPTNAINSDPLTIDLGKCTFCGECSRLFPDKIKFTTDYRLAVNEREKLIITEGITDPVTLSHNLIRSEIRKMFS